MLEPESVFFFLHKLHATSEQAAMPAERGCVYNNGNFHMPKISREGSEYFHRKATDLGFLLFNFYYSGGTEATPGL